MLLCLSISSSLKGSVLDSFIGRIHVGLDLGRTGDLPRTGGDLRLLCVRRRRRPVGQTHRILDAPRLSQLIFDEIPRLLVFLVSPAPSLECSAFSLGSHPVPGPVGVLIDRFVLPPFVGVPWLFRVVFRRRGSVVRLLPAGSPRTRRIRFLGARRTPFLLLPLVRRSDVFQGTSEDSFGLPRTVGTFPEVEFAVGMLLRAGFSVRGAVIVVFRSGGVSRGFVEGGLFGVGGKFGKGRGGRRGLAIGGGQAREA